MSERKEALAGPQADEKAADEVGTGRWSDQQPEEAAAGILEPSSPQWRALTMRRLRLERGWTLRQVGQKVGLNASQVSRAENGLRRPWTIPVICGVFGVTEEEVLRPCPNCNYRPPAGYTCQRCGTEATKAQRSENGGGNES